MNTEDFSDRYRAGEVLAGRYRIVKVLGAGGMGVVLAARHLDLDALVAIKLLRPEVLSNRSAVERFAVEARAAVRIKSEHVARVTDVNTLPDGSPYMVMEHLEGHDLATLLKKGGPLSVENAVDYLLQACEALVEAHALGIVHRDLKPGNLFLSRRADGSAIIKVLDFGISKSIDALGADGGALTGTGTILGSPMYMSPEQLANSKTVDRRTDIWALGVILHQTISGVVPFAGDTLPELLFAIVQSQPPPLASLRPDVPPALSAVVARCLEKDRSRRFDDIGELAKALAPLAAPRSQISIERILRMAPPARFDGQGERTTTQAGDLPAWPWQPKEPDADTQGTWGQTASRIGQPKRAARVVAVLGGLVALGAVGVAVRSFSFKTEPAPLASTGSATLPVVSSTATVSELNAALPATSSASDHPQLLEAADNEARNEPSPAISAPPELDTARTPRVDPRVTPRHAATPAKIAQRAAPGSVVVPVAPVPVATAVAVTPAPARAPGSALSKSASDWEEDRQ